VRNRITRGSEVSKSGDIRLVQRQHAVVGKIGDHGGDSGGAVPAAHRVVGIGDVDQFRACFPCLGDQGYRVFGVTGIWHPVQCAAVARDVVGEGRIGPGGGHDRVARFHHEPHQFAQEPVDAGAHHDGIGFDIVLLCKGLPQVVTFRVAIHPGIGGRLRDGVDHAGRWAEAGFVGAKARGEGPS